MCTLPCAGCCSSSDFSPLVRRDCLYAQHWPRAAFMVKIVLREVLLRKLDLPCSTLQCLAVARATLTAVSALVRRPDCWKKLADVVHGVSQWSGREYCRILCLAWGAIVRSADRRRLCSRRRNRSCLWTRDIMDPVYKAKPCSQLILCPNGASAYLPAAILYVAEHWIVDPN